MKKTIASILLLVPVIACAGSSTSSVPITENTGIVTPDIATGVRQYEYFNNDTNGNMVVCEENKYSLTRGKCDDGWKNVITMVPYGKKYVGFKIVNVSYGYQRLQVWWK